MFNTPKPLPTEYEDDILDLIDDEDEEIDMHELQQQTGLPVEVLPCAA